MSVSISRFVDVMRDGKPWGRKGRAAKDAEVFATLGKMQAVLDTLKSAAPDKGLTDLQSRHDALERALNAAGDAQDSKKIQAAELDNLAKRAKAALADAEGYAAERQRRAERQALLKQAIDQADSLAADIGKLTDAAARRDFGKTLAPLQAQVKAYAADADFSAANQRAVMDGLQRTLDQMRPLGGLVFRGVTPSENDAITRIKQQAAKKPDSDAGRLLESLGDRRSTLKLGAILKHQRVHGVDFAPLNTEESLAVYLYLHSDGDYRRMHSLMLGSDGADRKEQIKIDLCHQALRKLPDYPASPTFRLEDGGNYAWDEQFVQGKVFATKIFWSTGKGHGVAASGMKGPCLSITVHGKTGKDVAKMAELQGEGGGEVLFAAGTKFKTLSVQRPYDLDDTGKMATPKTATVNIVVAEV